MPTLRRPRVLSGPEIAEAESDRIDGADAYRIGSLAVAISTTRAARADHFVSFPKAFPMRANLPPSMQTVFSSVPRFRRHRWMSYPRIRGRWSAQLSTTAWVTTFVNRWRMFSGP